ncbi:MAG TPA: ABC transporter ATP-binding protein [Candidatus Eisenbacteria bacterium]|jgi:phospholipid/cholesterol/gamma-HCH transport system ATP-binding protein|nr:ABC transporter ATP-binding protein [Candidatus Eisenbacteria bacterium]
MIEVKKVSKSFNNRLVLNEIDLTVEKGETLVIIGRSGCGKSVLLKHMIGILRPDKGDLFIDGISMASLSGKQMNQLRMRFGMLFQFAALFDSMTVGENVGFALIEHTSLSHRAISERVEESLELVGLKGIQDLKPAELSGGMKKRVALARAICMRPEFLLYDEPTTGLDPIMADAINDLINELHDKLKVTSVAVTHDMVSAYKIATRIAMMYQGRIIKIGTPDEIRNTQDPVVRQFITGSASGPITDIQFKSLEQIGGDRSS